MASKHIPLRFRENAFRRYEAVIREIADKFPDPVSIDPGEFSVETFTCRLRDAISSVLLYEWPTTVNISRLREIRPALRISVHNGKVHAGPKVLKVKTAGTLAAQGGTSAIVVTHPTIEVLESFAHLLSCRVLTPVRLIGCDEDLIVALEAQFDISHVVNDDGSITLF